MREFLLTLFDLFWEKLDDIERFESSELERFWWYRLPSVQLDDVSNKLGDQRGYRRTTYWRAAKRLGQLGYIRQSRWGGYVLTEKGAELAFKMRRPKRQRRKTSLST